MNARDFSFTTLRDALPRSSKTSMESQEDRKCSETDIWSVRGKMRHRFEGWIRERCRKAEEQPVSGGCGSCRTCLEEIRVVVEIMWGEKRHTARNYSLGYHRRSGSMLVFRNINGSNKNLKMSSGSYCRQEHSVTVQ
jgi:hypothetical protein